MSVVVDGLGSSDPGGAARHNLLTLQCLLVQLLWLCFPMFHKGPCHVTIKYFGRYSNTNSENRISPSSRPYVSCHFTTSTIKPLHTQSYYCLHAFIIFHCLFNVFEFSVDFFINSPVLSLYSGVSTVFSLYSGVSTVSLYSGVSTVFSLYSGISTVFSLCFRYLYCLFIIHISYVVII